MNISKRKGPGMLYVIGIGPGGADQITPRAEAAIGRSTLVAGYALYIDLIRDLVAGKKVIRTAMRGEVERCRKAIEAAVSGETVSVVSSGDAGVYGMAGLVYQLCAELAVAVQVEVIPGITAATSAAAILGAPLTHDFAVISLSDLLTPWEEIESRLDLASKAGFVIAIYNPVSKKRADFLKKACSIVSRNLGEGTACGYVKNIAREGQVCRVLTLKELASAGIDMFTTVIIGSKNTRIISGKLVTPRGYRLGGTA